jgi:hypothetical protein
MAVVGAIGSLVSGVTGMMQANYQAKVAKMNEKVALYNAERARTRSTIDAQEKDTFETRALLGDQEVAQAASGVSIAGKSQVATRNTARLLGRRDTQNIIEDGQMQAYNHKVEAANFAAEAKAAKMSGMSSLLGGFLGAAGGLAGSGSSLLGGAKASSAQAKYVPKPVLKPQPFRPVIKTAPIKINKGSSMGFTYPSFNPMKRRFGH